MKENEAKRDEKQKKKKVRRKREKTREESEEKQRKDKKDSETYARVEGGDVIERTAEGQRGKRRVTRCQPGRCQLVLASTGWGRRGGM